MAREPGVDDHRFTPEDYAYHLQLRNHQATMDINQNSPENYVLLSELAGMTVTPDWSIKPRFGWPHFMVCMHARLDQATIFISETDHDV